MSEFIDYYLILDISPSSTEDEIRAAIRSSLREWQKRTGHPDLERRQGAEKRIKDIAEAEAVLFDPAKRSAYDRTRTEKVREGTGRAEVDEDLNWMERTLLHLRHGDLRKAEYAAREATHQSPKNPDAWQLKAETSRELEKFDDAVYELEEATKLSPGDSSIVFDLANVFNDMGQYPQALAEYEHGRTLDPENFYFDIGKATVYLSTDQETEAIKILEPIRAANPGDDAANNYLAIAYHDRCVSIGTDIGGGSTLVTTAPDAEAVNVLMDKALALDITDPELKSLVVERQAETKELLEKSWIFSTYLEMNGFIEFAKRSVFLFCAGILLFSMFASAGNAGSVLGIFVLGGIGYLLVQSKWFVPGWKHNAYAVRKHKTDMVIARFRSYM